MTKLSRSDVMQHGAGVSAGAVHVAVIMDGNGRWATARGLPRIAGHKAGAEALRRTIRGAITAGVSWLTIYAFSSENWRRPEAEILDLTGLLRHYLRHEVASLVKEGVRLRFLGDRSRFESDIGQDLLKAEQVSAGNTLLNLNVALSYGSRAEIVDVVREAMRRGAQGNLQAEQITEEVVAAMLSTSGMPDPDLVIRTGGDQRLSNFLLWQSAYAELLFLDRLWPDFTDEDFHAALVEFARRERRFGARPV